MKVATFNANSVRKRLEIILEWLAEHEPDVLAIQETKCQDHDFPVDAFADMGYQVAAHGMKSYNGVAIVARETPLEVATGFGDEAWPEDCRIIAATVGGVRIVNTYVPNGTALGTDKFAYKLRWLDRFRRYCDERIAPSQPAIWLGDINIAPTADDVFDAAKKLGRVGHHPDEFAGLGRIVEWGWSDCFRKFTSGPGHYTFWEFVIPKALERNLGWRIDHIYGSPEMAARCTGCVVDRVPRALESPSDHTFVVATFS